MRTDETAKVVAAKTGVALAALIASPVLLMAGTQLRSRYLRHIFRDGCFSRRPPLRPVLGAGSNGSINAHCSSVRSDGYPSGSTHAPPNESHPPTLQRTSDTLSEPARPHGQHAGLEPAVCLESCHKIRDGSTHCTQ